MARLTVEPLAVFSRKPAVSAYGGKDARRFLLDSRQDLFSICSMKDFGEKYRGVTYFGLWADEASSTCGQQDAFAIVADAVRRAPNEDVRGEELEDALIYLERYAVRTRPFLDFRQGLGILDPVERFCVLKDAALRIARLIGG